MAENQTEEKMDIKSEGNGGQGDAAESEASQAKQPDTAETKPQVKKEKETELEKYWKPVKENPGDFTGWTYLLQFVEQENDIESARQAYDAFLARYPYCYGYWKKYADLEKRQGDLKKSVEIFEKGAKAVPLSSELWLHYINFYIKEFINEDETRKLYERAITAAGTDFRSDKLWDNYINWEKERDLRRVTTLYDRLFRIPTQLYSHHFDNFKKHVLNHHPREILSLDEFFKLRTEVVKETDGPLIPEGDDAPPPGDEPPPGMEPSTDKGDAEEAMKVREKILNLREVAFKQNEEEVSKRWAYEEGIKRPYFHVKPLERSQLKNWREYLDYEIQNGTHERVVVLFERCMIAAALYEDFWLKYARYLEEHFTNLKKAGSDAEAGSVKFHPLDEGGLEAVRNVYKRACNVHLPKKPYIHMAWAAFEERQGKHGDAWRILTNLEETLPGMVMVAMRRISLERRIGDRDKTEMLFQEYITKSTDLSVRAFYVIKYARYLFKVLGDEVRAKKIIFEALEKDPKNEKLYIQLLDIEYQKHPVDVNSALDIFSKALENEELSVHTKIKMSQRRLEFLEDFGSSIVQLKECYDEHQKLIKDMQSEKKRKISDPAIDTEPAEKKVKTNGAAEQPVSDYSAYWSQYQTAAGYSYPATWSGYAQQYYNS
ncbi:pre-mRNA-processing factor 39-like [Mercenaria mercenaria]|uniref:pre-mRNA-processing factor 39-like n=1 Tax=Mercenaria mercenaria TaxID=6596 RepID=UPI00234EE557|nr:pre-mRNA-processing factor 39-like [Mercenaria mercenaria]